MIHQLTRVACTLGPLLAWLAQASTVPISLSGLVSDAATGKPLPGMVVQLMTDWEPGPIKEARVDTTDAGGWFLFSNLPLIDGPVQANLTICPDTDGYPCMYAFVEEIYPGQDRRQDFQLYKPIVWNFRIAEMANPDRAIVGAHVTVLTPMLEQSQRSEAARTHIGRSDSLGHVDMHRSMEWTGVGPLPVSRWREAGLGTKVRIAVSKAGYRTQILTKPISLEALDIDAEAFPDGWVLTDTFFLEPESPPASRTLSGSVSDHAATSEGLAVLFAGAIEGQPFVLFDNVRGGRISIMGIPETVSEGSVFSAYGDSLRIAPEDFFRDFHLTTRSPILVGLARGSGPDRGTRHGRFLPGTGKSRVDILGRKVGLTPKGYRSGRTGTLP